MCDMPNCDIDATYYVFVRPLGLRAGGRPAVGAGRLELCTGHYAMTVDFEANEIIKIEDRGPLGGGLRVVK